MSNDTNVIWRKGDTEMPEHAKNIVEEAKAELVGNSMKQVSDYYLLNSPFAPLRGTAKDAQNGHYFFMIVLCQELGSEV